MTTVPSKVPTSFMSPRKSVWAKPWWEGAARGALVLMHCSDCGAITHPPGPNCTSCLSSNLEPHDASGSGTVYSYTVTTRPMHEEFVAEAPYTIAYVVLDEGPTLVSWLRGVDAGPEVIGLRVGVEFDRIDDDTYLHRFVPLVL